MYFWFNFISFYFFVLHFRFYVLTIFKSWIQKHTTSRCYQAITIVFNGYNSTFKSSAFLHNVLNRFHRKNLNWAAKLSTPTPSRTPHLLMIKNLRLIILLFIWTPCSLYGGGGSTNFKVWRVVLIYCIGGGGR